MQLKIETSDRLAEAASLAAATTALVLRKAGDTATGGAMLPPQAASVWRDEADKLVGRYAHRLAWPAVRLIFIGQGEEWVAGGADWAAPGSAPEEVGTAAVAQRGCLFSRLDRELVLYIAALVADDEVGEGDW